MEPTDSTRRGDVPWGVILLKIGLVALALVALNLGVSRAVESVQLQVWPEHMEIVDRVVLTGLILYVGLMALPFLPGVEIGLAFMMVLGFKGIVVVYACTLIALSIGFGLGRLLPARFLVSFLEWLHLTRAATLLRSFDGTPPEQRLQFVAEKASSRLVVALIRRRYLLVAVLLNLPGNALIGGGGGIAMMAGMSRLFPFPAYLLLIAFAVLPGPLLILLSNLVH